MTDPAETDPHRDDVQHEARVGISAVLKELGEDHPGITASKLRFLEDKGLVHPARTASGYRKFSRADVDRLRRILELQRDRYLPLKVIREQNGAFDDHALAITRAALALTAHGLEPRHLRPFKAAADRELGLVERAVAPLTSRRDAASRARAVERAQEISGLCLTIHTSLVRSEIDALQERAAVEG